MTNWRRGARPPMNIALVSLGTTPMRFPLPTIHGKGGHGRVVFDAMKAANPYHLRVRWTDDAVGTRPRADAPFIVAIGDNAARKAICEQLGISRAFNVIHPQAALSQSAILARGIFVGPHAWVGPSADLGNGCIINTGAIVEHECIIGPYAHVGPGAVLSGLAEVGEGALIGAGATILPSKKIGPWSIVGAGAVVVHDVPAGEVWVGVPARRVRVVEEKRE